MPLNAGKSGRNSGKLRGEHLFERTSDNLSLQRARALPPPGPGRAPGTTRPPPITCGRSQLTLEMVSGALKSLPPTKRKPQGEGPRRTTECDIAGRSLPADCTAPLRSPAAAPSPAPSEPAPPERPACRAGQGGGIEPAWLEVGGL